MTNSSADYVDYANRPSSARYVVLALLCAAALSAYVARNCIGVAEANVSEELGLSLEQMGWVMGSFFWSYALMQIPGAWLGQRWGSRRALAFYAVVWSLATLGMGVAGGMVTLLTARIVLGMAQAGLFPCSINTISHWIPGSRTAMASGLLGGFMSIGGVIANALTGLLLYWSLSYHLIFALYALPGVLWGVAFYVWFRDRPGQHRCVNPAELALITAERSTDADWTNPAEPTPWRRIVTSPAMWFICGQQFLRSVGYVFYATWFPKFLTETRGVSIAEAGLLSSLPLVAIIVGSPVGGVIVDAVWNRTHSRRWSRQAMGVVSMLLCGGLIFAAYFANSSITAVLLISAGSFWAGAAGSCGYAITIDMGGNHVPTVFGIMNMIGNFGAAVCPVVVAWIVEATDGNWPIVLCFFALVYLAAAACWAMLNPNGCITQVKPMRDHDT